MTENRIKTDEELYRDYLSGQKEALEILMEKYGEALTLYINGYVHDLHEAEDLMMESFVYLFVKRPKLKNGGFKAYLYKMARNMAIRYQTRYRARFLPCEILENVQEEKLLEEMVFKKEQTQKLHEAMKQLPREYQEALYFVYFEHMSYEQTAKVMRKTIRQVTNLVYRGKQRLKVLIGEEGQ